MLSDFFNDLNKAKKAEQIALNVFKSLTDEYKFDDVSDIVEYRYKGDIRATAADGKEVYIDIKDDSRIADTRNVLCEYENYIKDGGYFIKGNMLSNYDYMAVVSQRERKIYVIDFPILQANYKKGIHKVIYHAQQDTYCYLCSLSQIGKWGALVKVIDY